MSDRDLLAEALGKRSVWVTVLVLFLLFIAVNCAHARDLDGRFAASPLHDWFQNLATPGGGRCCDEADGNGINDIDWTSANGHYRVRLEGEWVDVPDNKVVTEPNRAGRAMVWTYRQNGKLAVRCFMPGSMT